MLPAGPAEETLFDEDAETFTEWPPSNEAFDSATQRLKTIEPDGYEEATMLPEETLRAAPPYLEGAERPAARLVSSVPGNPLSIDLHEGKNRVGRQRNGNHIVLVGPEISRFHAELIVFKNAFYLRDLGSANGTRLNGKQIRENRLEHGDLVSFSEEFSFYLQAPESDAGAESDDLTATIPRRGGSLQDQRRQLSKLYEISKSCMAAGSLDALDRLLVDELERAVVHLTRGFITYRLASGEWKLVMVGEQFSWQRETIRDLLQLALQRKEMLLVTDSRGDPTLGVLRQRGSGDCRLLLPLVSRGRPVGAIFVISAEPGALDRRSASYFMRLSEIAALALSDTSRFSG